MNNNEYTIDASGQILGRLAAKIAVLLRGKNKASWLPNIEPKSIVTVFNTNSVKFSGKKLTQKLYIHHSGYPGGLKKESLGKKFERDSREVIREAVYGMLPKNKTRDKVIKNLKLYKNEIK
jgi:large subunit ribosomal protein L13